MLESKEFDDLYPQLSPSLHIKTFYEYEVDEANIDEDVCTTKKTENNVSKSAHSNLHNIELPQHRYVDDEGNIRNNEERVTYSKLQDVSSQFVTAVLHNKS